MNDFFLSLMLTGALSTGPSMPYWSYANQYDIMPVTSGYTSLLRAGMSYDSEKVFQWHWGVSAGLRGDAFNRAEFIPDEIYGGVKWRNLELDLGYKHSDIDFLGSSESLGSISSTGGNFIMTGNARTMPGYRLTLRPAKFPGTEGHLQVAGAFADYAMTDARYEPRALVHNTQFYLIGNAGRVSITLGINHWAMWDGSSFNNYLRMLVGSKPVGGSLNDQMNVFGNQLGTGRIAVRYNGDGWKAEFRHDHPYDDKSGMFFKNFPDGVNTLSFSFDDKDRWVSDILYEFQYTMYQSGPIHDNETDKEGKPIPWQPGLDFTGNDDYFNNYDFKSGWTYYGMTIGDPLIFPKGTRDRSWIRGGVTLGVENNRLIANHVGLSGKLFRKVPYRLMATYTLCYGTYKAPYAGNSQFGHPWGTVKETPLSQFSIGFTCEIPFIGGKLLLLPGIYGDAGQVLPNAFAATLGLRYVPF